MEDNTKIKQPIGLMPIAIHNRKRARDIVNAMDRYIHSDRKIPVEWIDELKALEAKA